MTQKELNEFPFADAQSKANSREALRCVKAGERGAFVVNSNSPGTGKTQLVRGILEAIDPAPVSSAWPAKESQRLRLIDRAFAQSRPYLWLDDVYQRGRRPLDSSALQYLTNSLHWVSRPARKNSMVVTVENNLVLFIAGNEVFLPIDLMRRVKVINLVAEKL